MCMGLHGTDEVTVLQCTGAALHHMHENYVTFVLQVAHSAILQL